MTQALFDLELLDRFVERLGGPVADPGAGRRLAAAQPRDGAAPPQRGAGHQRARAGARRAAGRRPGRAGSRARAGARARRGLARPRGGHLRDPAVQAADGGARPVRELASALGRATSARRRRSRAAARPRPRRSAPARSEPRSRRPSRAAARTRSRRPGRRASTIGPPEFPLRTSPRSATIGRASWKRPYASRAPTRRRAADPDGRDAIGPVAGIAEQRPGVAAVGIGERGAARPPRPGTRSTATSFRASNATTRRDACHRRPGGRRPARRPRDDVGVRDDEAAARRSSRSPRSRARRR